MSWRLRVAGSMALPLCSLACGDPESRATEANMARLLAEQFCDEQLACECADFETEWGDLDACIETHVAAWQDRQAFANSLGLEFAAHCVDAYIAPGPDCESVEERLASSDTNAEAEPFCQFYFGDKQVGESCQWAPWISECAQGLTCLSDKCIDPEVEFAEAPARVGEDCMNVTCEVTAYCGPDYTCVERHATGESCSLEKECMSYCCADGVCGPSQPWVCGLGCAP